VGFQGKDLAYLILGIVRNLCVYVSYRALLTLFKRWNDQPEPTTNIITTAGTQAMRAS
jgi:hypothetical protein